MPPKNITPELKRTRSAASSFLMKTDSFTNLFKKRKRTRSQLNDDDDNTSSISTSDDQKSVRSSVKSTKSDGSSTSGKERDPKRQKVGRRSSVQTQDSDSENNVKEKALTEKEQAEKKRQEEEFLKKEKEYDELLPEEYRKFRPKGYKMNVPPTDRPIRIYADGVFDLFHLGHMRQLEQCKKAMPNVVLVCGIPNDVETHKRKGLTVLTDKQRYETLRHCKWVDEVIEDAPWILSIDFLKEHKIDYCAHDDLPYVSAGIDDIYKPMKEAGMFLATQRTEGISTSDIITKIIRDYDKYLMRNFARGATRKELNVSWLKKNELDFKKNIEDFRNYFKKTNESLNSTSKDLYFEVREFLRGKNNNRRENDDRKSNKSLKNAKSLEDVAKISVRSPAADFASRFNGNELLNHRRNGSTKSLIANFKEWVNGFDSHSEYDSHDDSEQVASSDPSSPSDDSFEEAEDTLSPENTEENEKTESLE